MLLNIFLVSEYQYHELCMEGRAALTIRWVLRTPKHRGPTGKWGIEIETPKASRGKAKREEDREGYPLPID